LTIDGLFANVAKTSAPRADGVSAHCATFPEEGTMSDRLASFRPAVFARRALTVLGTLVTLAYCAQAAAETARCRVVGRPVQLPDLPEASGVAVSHRTPRVLWSHNDSSEPVVFALDSTGAVLGRVRVAGADVANWEAVAVGPCLGGSCLYVADIGDNNANRPRVTVYRVPEPAPGETVTRPAEALHATYPDGAHDAEALFATPEGDLFIVTKGETGPIALYRFPRPLRAGPTVRLERIAVLGGRVKKKDRITDAGASPDGRWIALRTRDAVTFYRTADLTAGRRGEPLHFDVTGLGEPQGEGIALGTGATVYLVGEGGGKKRPGTLARIQCALP
jgi:hypothetical protein